MHRRGVMRLAAAGAGGALVSPVAGALCLLDARIDVTNDGSGQCSAWGDQSGSGNNATQPTPGARPQIGVTTIGGQAALKFLSGDCMFVSGISTTGADHTVLCVIKQPTPTSSTRKIFDASLGRYELLVDSAIGQHRVYTLGGSTGLGGVTSGDQSLAFVNAGTTCSAYRGGAFLASATITAKSLGGTSAIGANYIASGAYLQGSVAFFAVYDWALSAPEIAQMAAYTAQEWGV